MLQAIRENAQRQRLHPCNCGGAVLGVREHAGQLAHLRQPAPILFLLRLDRELYAYSPRLCLASFLSLRRPEGGHRQANSLARKSAFVQIEQLAEGLAHCTHQEGR